MRLRPKPVSERALKELEWRLRAKHSAERRRVTGRYDDSGRRIVDRRNILVGAVAGIAAWGIPLPSLAASNPSLVAYRGGLSLSQFISAPNPLSAADAAAGATGFVYIDVNVSLAANTVLSAKWIGYGGVITLGAYNLSGNFIAPANVQMFNVADTGTLTFTGQRGGVTAYPEWFGAVGDGATDDRPPTQACMDAVGLSGGGTVLFGAKTYRIVATQRVNNPTNVHVYDGQHLVMNYSNICIAGQSRYSTSLQFYGYGNLNPTTNWQVVNSQVWRGGGIFVRGGSTSGGTLTGAIVRDIQLNGVAGYTGDRTFPANVTTGDGWDETHKAIWMEQDYYYNEIQIIDVECVNWRGEQIYQAGANGQKMTVSYCELHSTNGDGISVSLALTAVFNEIYQCAGNGIDNLNYGGPTLISSNYVHDITVPTAVGISVGLVPATAIGSTVPGPQTIINNVIVNCVFGLVATRPTKMTIRLNTFYDCGFSSGAYRGLQLVDDGTTPISDTVVDGNILKADQQTLTQAIIVIETGSPITKNLSVTRNIVGATANGLSNGYTYNVPFSFVGGSVYPNISVSENSFPDGVGFNTTGSSVGLPTLLSTTNPTVIATLRPAIAAMYSVGLVLQVANASTTTTATLTWLDQNGASQSFSWESAASLGTGTYSLQLQEIYCGTASPGIKVTVTAGTSNNVTAAAQINQSEL